MLKLVGIKSSGTVSVIAGLAEISTPSLPVSFSIWYDDMPLSRFLILVMPGKHLDKAGFMRAVDLRDLLADTAPVKHRINSRPVREASMKLSPMVCCRRTNIRLQNWPCPEGRVPLLVFIWMQDRGS